MNTIERLRPKGHMYKGLTYTLFPHEMLSEDEKTEWRNDAESRLNESLSETFSKDNIVVKFRKYKSEELLVDMAAGDWGKEILAELPQSGSYEILLAFAYSQETEEPKDGPVFGAK